MPKYNTSEKGKKEQGIREREREKERAIIGGMSGRTATEVRVRVRVRDTGCGMQEASY